MPPSILPLPQRHCVRREKATHPIWFSLTHSSSKRAEGLLNAWAKRAAMRSPMPHLRSSSRLSRLGWVSNVHRDLRAVPFQPDASWFSDSRSSSTLDVAICGTTSCGQSHAWWHWRSHPHHLHSLTHARIRQTARREQRRVIIGHHLHTHASIPCHTYRLLVKSTKVTFLLGAAILCVHSHHEL